MNSTTSITSNSLAQVSCSTKTTPEAPSPLQAIVTRTFQSDENQEKMQKLSPAIQKLSLEEHATCQETALKIATCQDGVHYEENTQKLCDLLARNSETLKSDHTFFDRMKPYFQRIVDFQSKRIFHDWQPGDPIDKLHTITPELKPLFCLMSDHITQLGFDFTKSPEMEATFRSYFRNLRTCTYPEKILAGPIIDAQILQFLPVKQLIDYFSRGIEQKDFFHAFFWPGDCRNVLQPRFNDIAQYVIDRVTEQWQNACHPRFVSLRGQFQWNDDPGPPNVPDDNGGQFKIPNELSPLMQAIRPFVKSLTLSAFGQIGSDNLVKLWVFFPNLQEIDLSYNRGISVSEADLHELASRYPKLRRLDVGHCLTITDAVVRTIAERFHNLESFNLGSNQEITDAGLRAIAQGCPNLESLDLSFCMQITDAGLRAIAQGCLNLESLSLRECKNITDEGIRAIVKSCPHLKSLDLSGCSGITDSTLRIIAQSCSTLCSLNLTGCRAITDEGICAIAQGCPHLESIGLDKVKKITDKGLLAIAERYSDLKHLDLASNPHVNDAVLCDITQRCHDLRTLGLAECAKITDKGLRAITQNCPNLATLDLNMCKNITDDGLRDAINLLPPCSIVV